MKTKDIKRMGDLYKDVIESKVEEACAKKPMKEEELDPVNKDELKKDFKDRKDKDINNDGKVDSSDEYLVAKRKAISKNMKEFAEMLLGIELSEAKQPGDSGTAKQEPDDNWSGNAKKMKKDAEEGKQVLDVDELINANAEDAKDVKQAPARKGDNLDNGDGKKPKGVKEFFDILDGLSEAKKDDKEDMEDEEENEDEEGKEAPTDEKSKKETSSKDDVKETDDISTMIKKNSTKRQDAEDGEEDKEAGRK